MSGRDTARTDDPESPLAWLRSRRDKSGERLIDEPSYAAGERLRRDFALAALGPRTTMDWGALGSRAERRASGPGAGASVAEAASAARRRVAGALDAVGPEFAILLVEVCWQEKGLSEVERERSWPLRSAKVVLRLALAALARHYGLATAATGARAAGISHWGAPDYRPRG